MGPTLTPVTDGKMESESLSLTFNKLSTYGYQVFKEPFTISAESVSDFKNNAYKVLVQLDTFGDKVPVEVILTSGAVYLGIDKVTDRMLKIPVDADLPAAGNSSDSDQVIVTVISENNVLRSFDYTGTKNGKKNTVSFTTTEKDGAFTVKGAVTIDEKELFSLSYEQIPNDKNSADGELMLSIDTTDLFYYTMAEEDSEDSSYYSTMGLKLKFCGQKTDNHFFGKHEA